ncbi:heavy metal-binding domain-containing protein [uncultured Hymenobacter sp.]|uniref:heavy metal-binding domain-containing protein n=1 Tax=uncultured Hymenobacter sp. TaxID=170016 RepID=UPI0035C96C29
MNRSALLRPLAVGLISLPLSLLLAGCSADEAASSSPTNTVTGPAAGTAGPAGGHLYSCPMHPEVTSTQAGQTCPKCGMKLEHTDKVANGKTYQMTFKVAPAPPVAGRAALLRFAPQEAANPAAPVPLAVVHEKKIHLIIVRKDLSQFYHEHPEHTAQGDYQAPFTFPQGGDYVLFQDYTPAGSGHQLGRQPLTVRGAPYKPVKFSAPQMQWRGAGGYQAALAFDKPLKTGQLLGLEITLRKKGQPVTDLDHYLGALGHVVVISEDTERYLHVHPNEQADQGPTIRFNTSFEQAGRYRVFLQFNHGGQIHTADFTISVDA